MEYSICGLKCGRNNLVLSSKYLIGIREFFMLFLDEGGGRLTTTNIRAGHLGKDHGESEDRDSSDHHKASLKLNEDGRYVCLVCEKTFKTV